MIRFLAAILIMAITALGVYYLKTNPPIAKLGQPSRVQAVAVEVSKAVAVDYHSKVSTFGRINANSMIGLQPEANGKVIWINPLLKDGAKIEAGTLLLRIDPADYDINVRSAQADVIQAESLVETETIARELAIKDWRRLGNKGKIPPRVQREAQRLSVEAKLDFALARLEQSKLALRRTELRAPFDAKVLKTDVNLAQIVNSNSVVAQLFAIDSLQLRLSVSAKELSALGIPTAEAPLLGVAIMELDRRYEIPISIKTLDSQVDSATHEMILIADLDLKSMPEVLDLPLIGLWVEAKIDGKMFKQVIVIPREQLTINNEILVARDSILHKLAIPPLYADNAVALFDINELRNDLLISTPLSNPVEGTYLEALVNGAPYVDQTGMAATNTTPQETLQ